MALKSKFAKSNTIFKANKIFTDRKKPQAVFADNIRLLTDSQGSEQSSRIVVFYGKGGIGKTCLLKQLAEHSKRDVYMNYPGCRFHNLSISLEAYDYANPLNVLISIRNLLEGDGGLFDYALMQYYAKARVSMEEIKSKTNQLPALIVDVLNEAIGLCTASASIPKILLEKGLDFIKDARFRAKHKEEIQQIDTLDEFEIFERLPYYLGLCISHSASNGVIHVLFLDSYESLKARTEGMVLSTDSAQWLRELFLSCERTLFVISSRDRIDWEKHDEEWKCYLDQHLLSNLSDEDSRWFLEQVPVTRPDGSLHTKAIEDIVLHAAGVPLYLDLCVDLYEDAVNKGNDIDFSHFCGSATIIDRYIRHLKEKDQYAVRTLSFLKHFDYKFAVRMLEKQNLFYSEDALYALLEKSIFLPLEGSNSLWKVDGSIRAHIMDQTPCERKNRLLEDLLRTILETRDGHMYPYFSMAIEVVLQNPALVPSCRDMLFEALEHFSNSGYWNELHVIFSEQLDSNDCCIHALAVLAELIWLRRTGNMREAERFAHAHPLQKEDMGVWYYMYRFLQTHILHLSGQYDLSIARYRELLDEMDLIKNLIPSHIYNCTAIKYTDLLFLKGKFEDAIAMADVLLGRKDTALSDVVELLRIKGHIYRFRRLYSQANLIYEAALKLVRDHELRALEGKLYTNLAEVNCMVDPAASLLYYEKAMEKNSQMNSEIEIGKARAAAAVAQANLGNTDQGECLAQAAVEAAENTGYLAGKVFALYALAYVQKKAGRQDTCRAVLVQAAALIEQIGVYRFLLPKI